MTNHPALHGDGVAPVELRLLVVLDVYTDVHSTGSPCEDGRVVLHTLNRVQCRVSGREDTTHRYAAYTGDSMRGGEESRTAEQWEMEHRVNGGEWNDL